MNEMCCFISDETLYSLIIEIQLRVSELLNHLSYSKQTHVCS